MDITFNWKPEQALLERLIALAKKRGQTPEEIVTEVVMQYLEIQHLDTEYIESDPLVGLFASSPDLAMNSETILQQEIQEKSGWTWKEIQ